MTPNERAAARAITDQPPPATSTGDVLALVITDMHARRQVGIERYGTPLQPHNGRDSLIDAYQEALDLAAYLRQAIEERSAALAENARLREAVAAEREACAALAETHGSAQSECGGGTECWDHIAAAIRARSALLRE